MTADKKKLPVLTSPVVAEPSPSALRIEALKKRLEQHDDEPAGWLALGAEYLEIGHVADAAVALHRAIELDGDVVVARRSYADALGKLGRLDEAVYQLVQARRLAPEDPQVLHELGVAFYDKGLYDKALKFFAQAQTHRPDDATIRYAMGLAHEAKQDFGAAIAAYRAALQCEPDRVSVRETLADALASVGEIVEAMHQLETVLSVDRTNTRAAMNLEVLKDAAGKLHDRRLFGKIDEVVARCALVQEGKLSRRERDDVPAPRIEYVTGLVQMWVEYETGVAKRFSLVIPDPGKAALAKGRLLQVTVLSADGTPTTADFATAATLTFLREVLGLPLTAAATLYRELLQQPVPGEGGQGVVRDGMRVGFEEAKLDEKNVFALVVESASSPSEGRLA